MYDLTVVILSRNRPHFIGDAITSILNQEYKDFYFKISDNSTNNDVFTFLEEKSLLDNVEYKRRNNLSAVEHFNSVVEEVETRYFILFHDDDIMLPEMVKKLYSTISCDSSITAVGCNGYIRADNESLKKTMLRSNCDDMLIGQKDLIRKYSDKWNIVPFPSYIYDTKTIKANRIRFDNQAGNMVYDAVWLLKILSIGKIRWLGEPLMIYRKHAMQDSVKLTYRDQCILIRFFSESVSDGRKNKFIKRYRSMILYDLARRRLKQNKKISLFILKQVFVFFYYSPYKLIYFTMFNKNIIKRLFYR